MSPDPEDPDAFDPDPDWADQENAAEAERDEVLVGEVVDEDPLHRKLRQMFADYAAALDDQIHAMLAEPIPAWNPVGFLNDGSTVYVGPSGTREPLDLGDVARMSFGLPAPGRVIRETIGGLTDAGVPVRVHNDLGSPVLEVGGRPTAWFENWLRNKGMRT